MSHRGRVISGSACRSQFQMPLPHEPGLDVTMRGGNSAQQHAALGYQRESHTAASGGDGRVKEARSWSMLRKRLCRSDECGGWDVDDGCAASAKASLLSLLDCECNRRRLQCVIV